MTQQFHLPITPPPELVQQWEEDWHHSKVKHIELEPYIAAQAAQWGADQELEACRMEIIDGAGLFYIDETSDRVRLAEDIWTARRPKPPSLKEQALSALENLNGECLWETSDLAAIRRALEQLPEGA